MTITIEFLRSCSQDQVRTMSKPDLTAALEKIRSVRSGHMRTVERIHASAGGRPLTTRQQNDYDESEGTVKELEGLEQQFAEQLASRDFDRRGVIPLGQDVQWGDGRRDDPRAPEYREGVPLLGRQTFAGYARARNLVPEEEEGLSLRKVLRGVVLDDWKGADAERRAMSGVSGAAGGHMLPTVLSADLIDMVRNQTRVLQAGARLFPMENRTVDVAKWVTDPSVAWRSENSSIATSDAALDKITLTARTLSGITQVSRELLEDADEVEDQLRQAFAQVVALRIDQAALYGTGTAPEPRGVKNASPVTLTASMGANGAALTSYDPLIDAVGTLRDNNENPTAAIYSPRTGRALAKLKDTTNQPLRVPEYLDGVQRLETNQVPNTLTQGANTDASDIFTADWSQLYIGVRTQLQIALLTERYADTGQIGLLTWWRGDVAVARTKAFHVTSGVR